MPLRFARAKRGDNVEYRNADGEKMSGKVLRDTRAPSNAFTATPSGSGGTLAAGTYSYKIAFVFDTLTTCASAAVTATTSGSTGSVAIDVTAVAPAGTPAWTAWKVYGRTGGSELLMATVTAPTKTWTDDNSVTPSGALPTDTGNVTIRLGSGVTNVANIGKASTVKDTAKYFKR